MAETVNIAELAALAADKLFSEFLWRSSPHRDQNWTCENPTEHNGRATHPSDLVLSYEEPYQASRTYINTDLKSYASGSISATQIKKSIFNLAQSMQCAELSKQWNELYVQPETAHAIAGMLFIYNHDGAYDKNFSALLSSIDLTDIEIPRRSRLFVIGPQDIFWLSNVRYEIVQMRGEGHIPSRDLCYFYHPSLARHKNVQIREARAATAEMLMGPWITLRYKQSSGRDNVIIFLREKGDSADDFLPVLDYLMNYQLIEDGVEVQIRTLSPHENAPANFTRAVDRYIADCQAQSDTADLLHNVKYSQMNEVHTTFSQLEVGMRDV